MFVVQISFFIVTFSSLYHEICQTTKEVDPHPHIAPCVHMRSVTILFFFFLCHLLKVGASIRHIVWEGQMEWTTLA